MINLRTATEAEFRDAAAPRPKTETELIDVIRELTKREHDYGTSVYAMSFAALAAFNYISSQLRVSGFQASCAVDFLSRNRQWKSGGTVLNYEDLLYPQLLYKFEISAAVLMEENKEILAKRAAEKLADSPNAHPDVIAHWKLLVANK